MNKSVQKTQGESQTADRAIERKRRAESATHPILHLQRTVGNQAVTQMLSASLMSPRQRSCVCGGKAECEECSKKERYGLQTKLDINEPGDIYEQEADRIAGQAMEVTSHSALTPHSPRVQRFAKQSNRQTSEATDSINDVLATAGRPLEPALRQDMEHRLGYDFSNVRIHSGPAAEQSARDVNAHAYTVGHNVVFGAGRFSPGTEEGRRLMAHELTHVVQQSGTDGNRIGPGSERSSSTSSILKQQLAVSNTVQRMVQRSPDDKGPKGPVTSKKSPQTSSKKVSFTISFDRALTRDEFIDLAETTIYGRRTPGEWTGVPARLKASDSPIEVLVPAATLKAELQQGIAELPTYIQKFLTTDKGPVGSHEDLKSVMVAGNILWGAGVTPDELLLLEYQQRESEEFGRSEAGETDLIAWAEGYVFQRQEEGEKALKNRIDLVALREGLDQWSQDDKNGIKNVLDGVVDEQIMHTLLHKHGTSYYTLVHAFEVELKAITTAFLSQAQVALFRIEKTYLANRNVGVEEEALRQAIEKIRPAMSQRDEAAAERDRRKDRATFYGAFPMLASLDPSVAEAETEVEKKDEELRKQSETAGLPVVTWKGFDWDAIRGGNVEGSRSTLSQFVAHAYSQIRSAQKKVATLQTLYKADRMISLTKAALGIEKGSVFDDIITYRAREETSDEGFWSRLWDIVTIALMFVPGNIGIFLRVGAGLIDATKAMDEYAEGMSLHKVDLASEAPSKLGVFLAVGGVLIDVPEMARGTVKVLSTEAKATLREGETLVKTGDESVAKAAKTIEGGGSKDIAPGVVHTSKETPADSLVREHPSSSDIGSTSKLTTAKATDPTVAEEMKKLGPVDADTRLRLESDASLRKALADNQLAASALKKCKSPCFPPMSAEQVSSLEHILRGYKKTGDYDENLVKQFLADNRDNLDDAIHALSGWEDSQKLDAFLRYAAEGGDIRKIAPKLDPKLVSAMQRRAHDVGVEYGHQQAIKDGLKDIGRGWENPIKIGGFDQGFDNIMVKGDIDTGEIFIVEYKGGRAGLSPGQMSLEWVKNNIKRLSLYEGPHGREMAEKLAKALKEGRLRGVVYSTPVVGIRETKKIGGVLIYDAVGIRLPPLPAP